MKTGESRYKPRVCQACGATFTPLTGNIRHCELCRTATCAQCGTTFTSGAVSSPKPGRKPKPYCSMACYAQAKTTRITVPCDQCGKPIERLLSQMKRVRHVFCNPTCRSTFMWANPEERKRQITAMKAGPYISSPKTAQLETARKLRYVEAGNRSEASRQPIEATLPYPYDKH